VVYRLLVFLGANPLEAHNHGFTIAAGPRQLSHFRVRVPRDSRPYFTLRDSRLPQPRGPGAPIYIPQEQGGPVIPPGTGSPFRRLLRLARLRWRYSNPPPLEDECDNVLRGQGYSTVQGAVTDGYGAMAEWRLVGEACSHTTSSTTNLTWSHPELNPWLQGELPAPNCPSDGRKGRSGAEEQSSVPVITGVVCSALQLTAHDGEWGDLRKTVPSRRFMRIRNETVEHSVGRVAQKNEAKRSDTIILFL
jgi:hypothetical protein